MYHGLGDDLLPEESAPAQISTGYLMLQQAQQATAGWDWHQWALAAIGGYLVVRTIFRAGRRGTQAVGKKVKKVGSGIRRRRKALKTVFTG